MLSQGNVGLPSVWIARGLGGWTPNCFLNPPSTLSNYVLGCQLQFTSQFLSSSDHQKFHPPANFSQFKHWVYQNNDKN